MRRWCVGIKRGPALNGGVLGSAAGYWFNKKDWVLIFFIFVFFIYASLNLMLG